MSIYEANEILIRRGNVMIVEQGGYHVIPRTVKEENVKATQDYPWFLSVKEAFEYGIKLPSDWVG